MATVTLDEGEQRLAIYFGRQRNAFKHSNNVCDERVAATFSSEDVHINGMGGEIAACKLLNRYPDFAVGHIKSRGDLFVRGMAIDVKVANLSRYDDAMLLVRQTKAKNPADIYLLMVGRLPTYVCAGWIPAAKILQPDNLRSMRPGYPPSHAMHQSRLNKNLEFLY